MVMGAFKNDGRHYDKTFTTALTGGKTSKPGFARGKPYNRALRRAGNAPLSPPAAVLLLKGSMSLDFRVATLPYKSSSFATPEGGSLLSAELLFS